MRSRTVLVMSANASFADVVTSPMTCTCPVVTAVSTATRDFGSAASSASSTESLMASQILSGCPSVTDSLVTSRPLLTMSSLHEHLVMRIISASRGSQACPPAPGNPYTQRAACDASPFAVAKKGRDRVNDTAGHQCLRPVLQCDFVAVGPQQPPVVVVHLERTAFADGVHDQEIARLALEFRPGVEQHVAVRVAGLSGESDDRAHVGQLPVGSRPD